MDNNQKSMGSQQTMNTPGGGEYRSMGDAPTLRDAAQRKRFHPGDRLLGRYRIVSELGQGGMGVVYRCFDETGGIEVALKALPPELSHNSIEMEEVRENFRLVEGLHHPSIAAAKTLERDEATGDTYLVMECVEGMNLRSWRKAEGRGQKTGESSQGVVGRRSAGGLALGQVVPVLQQIASALDFAHSQKIIHRDIKPANVMIRADGAVKVLDFGLAAQIQTSLSRVTRVHYGTSGTGPYMAPEQWRGQRQDARTDQYALAVMAYELLSGQLPFENPDAAVLREAVLKEAPVEIPGLERRAWQGLLRAMAKEPSQRFAYCVDFVAALSGDRSQKSRGRSQRWAGLAAAGVAAASAAYLGVEAYQERQEKAAEEQAVRARDLAFIAATNEAETAYLSAGWVAGTSRLDHVRVLGAFGETVAGELCVRWQAYLSSSEVARASAPVLALDPGQGLETKISEVRGGLKEADQALGRRDWQPALTRYDQVLELLKEVSQLEVKRTAAAEAQRGADGVKGKAEAANVKALAGPSWQAAERDEAKTKQMFEKGDFDLARNGWLGLSNRWVEIHAQAVSQMAAYGQAKKAYDAAVRAVALPKEVRAAGKTGPIADEEVRTYLGDYGGSAWTLALQHEKEAQTAVNTSEGAAAYKNASDSLKVASSDAAAKAAEAERKRQELADKAKKPRLKVTVFAEGVSLDGASVTLDGQTSKQTAPCMLDLEPGREHTITVSRVSDGVTKYVATNLLVKASWEGERTTNVVLAVLRSSNGGGLVAKTNSPQADRSVEKKSPPTPPPTTPPIIPEKPDNHLYYKGGVLESQPTVDPSRFVSAPQRFRKLASGRVADSKWSKTWVLYNPKEIMTFQSARQQAASLGGRLPTVEEMASLLTVKREPGDWTRLNGDFFPEHTRTCQFWTGENSLFSARKFSNGLTTLGALNWVVDFSDGTAGKKSGDDQYGVLVILDN
jgi:tRNA A-37 threonylcarbamoyl transferase component Bud32